MKPDEILTLGWREWVGLPQLGLPEIKAKVDTGASTSTVHAFEVETFSEDGNPRVRFKLHPVQRDLKVVVNCVADIIDERFVPDSGGHREQRLIISTLLTIGPWSWPIEMTLTNRDTMKFRMLLGRSGLQDRFLVMPDASYLVGEMPPRHRRKYKV